MKIEAYEAALKSVEHVLRCQKDNVKAIYRKAKVINYWFLFKLVNFDTFFLDCYGYGEN